METLAKIWYWAPIVIAPLALILFTMISAYVLRFKMPGSELGFDYVVFSIFIAVALAVGGAI